MEKPVIRIFTNRFIGETVKNEVVSTYGWTVNLYQLIKPYSNHRDTLFTDPDIILKQFKLW